MAFYQQLLYFVPALVRSYYARVQQRFSSNPTVPTNKFIQFQTILRDFNPNKETPIDIYKKVEQLFGPEHKDMVEDFLLFLKPGQAVQVGRLMDRISLVRMTGFIDLLHVSIVVLFKRFDTINVHYKVIFDKAVMKITIPHGTISYYFHQSVSLAT